MGCALAALSRRKGLGVAFVADAEGGKAARCGEACGAAVVADSLGGLRRKAGIVIIAVPDGAIASVVGEMTACGTVGEGDVVAHTSGLESSDILAPLRSLGARVCSMHPAFSFPEAFQEGLDGVPFAVEGDGEACGTVERVIDVLGGKTVRIVKEDKARYHLGCTMASNFLVTLAGEVDWLWKDVRGVDSVAYALPLIHATLKNIRHRGPVAALTGPIARGDADTVRAHLELLASLDRDRLCAYIGLGRLTLRLASEAGLPGPRRREIESLFREFEDGRS